MLKTNNNNNNNNNSNNNNNNNNNNSNNNINNNSMNIKCISSFPKLFHILKKLNENKEGDLQYWQECTDNKLHWLVMNLTDNCFKSFHLHPIFHGPFLVLLYYFAVLRRRYFRHSIPSLETVKPIWIG